MDPTYLTIAAAATLLGGISHQTIRAAIDRGDLSAYQPTGRHGRILIRPADLEAWVARGRVEAGA